MKQESWCVQVTKENREHVKKWMEDTRYDYSIGAYYGITRNNCKKGTGDIDFFNKILSLEEFYEKIGINTILQEKWRIQITQENQEILDKWRKENIPEYKDKLCLGEWIRSNDNFYNLYWDDYQILTTEQFIKWVLEKEFTTQDLREGRCAVINDGTLDELRAVVKATFPNSSTIDVIVGSFKYYTKSSNNEKWCGWHTIKLPSQSVKKFIKQLKMEKKITGYKCPMNLFNGVIKAGTIYKSVFHNNYHVYAAHINNLVQPSAFQLPKEIVESWEVVWEEVEKKITLSNGEYVIIRDEKVFAQEVEVDVKHIKALLNNTNTFGDTPWNIQYNSFDIGCFKNVTRADLQVILNNLTY